MKKILLVAALLAVLPFLAGCFLTLSATDNVMASPVTPGPSTLQFGNVSVLQGFVVDLPIYLSSSDYANVPSEIIIGGKRLLDTGEGFLLSTDLTASAFIKTLGQGIVVEPAPSNDGAITYDPRLLQLVGGASSSAWQVRILPDNNGRILLHARRVGTFQSGVFLNLRFLGQWPGLSPVTANNVVAVYPSGATSQIWVGPPGSVNVR